jgi:hypothetical protein
LSKTLKIEYAVLTQAEIHIHNGTNGVSNVQFFADRLLSRPRKPGKKSRLSLHLAALTATGCRVFYFEPLDPQPIEFVVSDIAVQLSDIRMGNPAEVQHAPGHVQATGRLQKLPFPDGRLGVVADIGVIRAAPPPVNCALRLIGFELGVAAPALPNETAAVLGGDAIDVFVDFSGDATFLNGRAVLKTIAGYRYEAVISGSLKKPSLDTGDRTLEFLFTRSRGALGIFLNQTASTGKGAFGSVVDTATGLAGNAAEMAGSFGRGLRGTVKGIAALDSSDIRSGIKEMGAALGEGAKDAIATAGGEVREGAGAIGEGWTGNVPARQWRDEIPHRWTNAWLNARNTIDQSAFPPVHPGRESAAP